MDGKQHASQSVEAQSFTILGILAVVIADVFLNSYIGRLKLRHPAVCVCL